LATVILANALKMNHTRLIKMKCRKLLFILSFFALPCISHAQPENPALQETTKDCNAPAFARILHSAKPIEARAYWLGTQLIKWPGVTSAAPDSKFRLYHSASGTLVASMKNKVSGADGAVELQPTLQVTVPTRFAFVGEGLALKLDVAKTESLHELHKQQMVLVQEDAAGVVIAATALQMAGALDALYPAAADIHDLGATVSSGHTQFKLWAPTAQRVSLCIYKSGNGTVASAQAMQWDEETGAWSFTTPADLSGKYFTYLVDVFARGAGMVRNRVTDPYSVSLTTDSKRSYIADLNSPKLKPLDWDKTWQSTKVKHQTDMSIYELHVRDFSINDQSVAQKYRGKYLAFTQKNSNGMKHLRALSGAGMTDIHLLPVFDIASVPEKNCVTPKISGGASSETQQAVIQKYSASDCFNWGYDPLHFTAPEGSYASDAADGATRIKEFRAMVKALHDADLRVGMDVVYNHTSASGQNEKSILDRIVPDYYHRLNDKGEIEKSTCCENTATEHMMMAKLMSDSVLTWARDYHIDSFRFDLMGHQPRDVMQEIKSKLKAATGRDIQLIGEGWNFGEVENAKRFVQASQLSLNGSGIGTFSDRARDAVRGGGPSDSGEAMIKSQGYINGLVFDANAKAKADKPQLLSAADMVRVGLAGSIRDYAFMNHQGRTITLAEVDYSGQPAGYVTQPDEVVNYVENHDNQTLFDMNAYKLPTNTSREDRAGAQILGVAINAFSQGIAYYHAGIDTLRSKSLDRNSYDSGDWFNRIDWTYRDNYFATGLPRKNDNSNDFALMKPLLENPAIKPSVKEIMWTRDAFRDLLKIRASSSLFRLRNADDIKSRLTFYNTGITQVPTVQVGHLNGREYAGAKFSELVYVINVDKTAHKINIPELQNKKFILHPVHTSAAAADKRIAQSAAYISAEATFAIPARSAAVFVIE
jgi:pullulanase